MNLLKSLPLALGALFCAMFSGLPAADSIAQERYAPSRDGDTPMECWVPSQIQIRPCISLPMPQACQSEANYPSSDSRQRVAATFINRTQDPLILYWIDFNGHRKFYKTIPAGNRHMQQTFVGHAWMLASNVTHQCLAVFRIGPE